MSVPQRSFRPVQEAAHDTEREQSHGKLYPFQQKRGLHEQPTLAGREPE
jgi:hypothetical protein